jgi:hypothetical protein
MLKKIAMTAGLGMLMVATVAWTQVEIRGVVSRVDPATRTVYLSDGRTVQVQPGATLTINGQPVALDAVQPGATAVVLPSPTTSVTTVTQPLHVTPLPAPVIVPGPPVVIGPAPVNATGTIAFTDAANNTITFQDGRVVRVGPNTTVTQQAPAVGSLQPGARVSVRDAMPIAYLPSGTPYAAGTQYMMGTVSRVEPASQQVVLSNGAVVHVGPAAVVRSGNAGTSLAQLRPGDEIVVQVMNPARVVTPAQPAVAIATVPALSEAGRYAGSALPYQSYADTRIEAAGVRVIWSPQTQ